MSFTPNLPEQTFQILLIIKRKEMRINRGFPWTKKGKRSKFKHYT